MWFWGILLLVVMLAWGSVSGILKRLPIVNNRRTVMIIAIVGLVLTTGIIGSLGIGSLGTVSATDVSVVDIQVTTDFTSDAGATPAENANVDDLIDVRMTDAQANETSGIEEVYTGILTVTRSGDLSPTSCEVTALLPADYADEAGDDGRRYNIVEKTTVGEYEVYIQDGAAATVTSPKEHSVLTFADGVSQRTLGISIEVDEEGHDALNQYSSKSVIIDVCGSPFEFKLHRMD